MRRLHPLENASPRSQNRTFGIQVPFRFKFGTAEIRWSLSLSASKRWKDGKRLDFQLMTSEPSAWSKRAFSALAAFGGAA